MSADMHIHIATPNITEEHFKCFNKNTLGSKYFTAFDEHPYECNEQKEYDKEYDRVCDIFYSEFPDGDSDNNEKRDNRWKELMDEFSSKYNARCRHESEIENTPNIWIGEVSWLKAALFEEPEMFIPGTVVKISDLIGEELPIITDGLINKIVEAFNAENNTSYSLANPKEVEDFLKQYKGLPCFTISW
jgi:hypothetical protein